MPAVRSRVSSLGVAVRPQAQTLLKRVSSATSFCAAIEGEFEYDEVGGGSFSQPGVP